MYRMHSALADSVVRAIEPNGSLTELALLRRCRDGLGRSIVRSSTVNKTVPFLKSV